MKDYPKISICVPIHDTPDTAFFLSRLLNSVSEQKFKDYEIVITKEGTMPQNTNAAIKKARGELVKILYLDDFFAHEDALQIIVDNFATEDEWLVTGCLHTTDGENRINPHLPTYNAEIHKGVNTIGSPSILTIRNDGNILFDENLTWLLDCDLYRRYYDRYGAPKIVNDLNIVIHQGEHQMTHKLSQERKLKEHYYLVEKYK